MKEPEKVSYKYRYKKKTNLITLQNFQKLFIENDMTWSNENNEFIYTVRTSTEIDRIKQITTKNFNQNARLDKIDRENTFWLQHESLQKYHRVYCYCKYFYHTVNLDDKRLYYFEQIRKQGFNKEKCKERKLVYTTSEYFKTQTPEEKKTVALVAKGDRQTIRAVLGTRFFVSEKIYNERRQNFFKNAIFAAKHDIRLILGFDFDVKNETVNMTIWDISLPFCRIKGRGLNFDQLKFF